MGTNNHTKQDTHPLDNIMSMKVLAVIKEELLAQLNVPVGIDANPVISKPYFASNPGSIYTEVIIEIEHIRTLGFVINLPPSLTFLLSDHFSNIFCNELVFHCFITQKAAPASNITWSNIQLLAHSPLQNHIPATICLRVEL